MSNKELLNLTTAFHVEKVLTPQSYKALQEAFNARMPSKMGRSGALSLPIRAWISLVKALYTSIVEPHQWMHQLDARLSEWITSLDADIDGFVSWDAFFSALAGASLQRRILPTYSSRLEAHRWAAGTTELSLWIDPWKRLAVATEGGLDVKLFSMNGSCEDVMLKGHTAPLLAMCYVGAHDKIVTTACDRCLIVWDHRRGVPMQRGTLENVITALHYVEVIDALVIAPLSGHVYPLVVQSVPSVSSIDHQLILSESLRSQQKHADWITALASSTPLRLVASGGQDKVIMLWNTDVGLSLSRRLVGHERGVAKIEFVEESAMLVSLETRGNTVLVWDPRGSSGVFINRLSHEGELVAMFVDRFSSCVMCLETSSSRLTLWDLRTPTARRLHALEPSDSTRPKSLLRGAALVPSSRIVLAAYTTHLAQFHPHVSSFRTPKYGERVFALFLDEITFHVVVVCRSVAFVVRGIDGHTECTVEYPFGRSAMIENACVVNGVLFCMSGRHVGLLKLTQCRRLAALQRVTGLSDDASVIGVGRCPIPHTWIFAFGTGSVAVGKLKAVEQSWEFEPSAVLGVPTARHLAAGVRLDAESIFGMQPAASVVLLSQSPAQDDLSTAAIFFSAPQRENSTVMTINTRTISRQFRRIDVRPLDAVFVVDRRAVAVLHAANGLTIYSLNFVKLAEVGQLVTYLGGMPHGRLSWIGHDRIVGAIPHNARSIAILSLSEVFERTLKNVDAAMSLGHRKGEVHSPPPEQSIQATGEELHQPIADSLVSVVHGPVHRGFAAVGARAFDLSSRDECHVKIHRFVEGHAYETWVLRGLERSSAEPFVVMPRKAWLDKNADADMLAHLDDVVKGSTNVVEAEGPTPDEGCAGETQTCRSIDPRELREIWGYRITDTALRSRARPDWHTALLKQPKCCIVFDHASACLTDLLAHDQEGLPDMDERIRILRDIILGQDALLENGLIHTELKPRHFVKSRGRWKCCSCDSVVPVGTDTARPREGFEYVPPEVASLAVGALWSATESASVWSIGALAFELASGKGLFRGTSQEEIRVACASATGTSIGLRVSPLLGSTSNALESIIVRCLTCDPAERTTLAGLRELIIPCTLPEAFSLSQGPSHPVPDANSAQDLPTRQIKKIATLPDLIHTQVDTVESAAAVSAHIAVYESLGSVHCIAGDSSSGLFVVADADNTVPSQGYVHLCSLDAAGTKINYHGRIPELDIGITDVQSMWRAPVDALSVASRRGLVLSSKPGRHLKETSCDGDDLTLADALSTVVPLVDRGGAEDRLLREWERLDLNQVASIITTGTSPRGESSSSSGMESFEAMVAQRTHFYSDTGAKRRPGEEMELYAPQPIIRMSDLQYAKVKASQTETILRRRKARVEKIIGHIASGHHSAHSFELPDIGKNVGTASS